MRSLRATNHAAIAIFLASPFTTIVGRSPNELPCRTGNARRRDALHTATLYAARRHAWSAGVCRYERHRNARAARSSRVGSRARVRSPARPAHLAVHCRRRRRTGGVDHRRNCADSEEHGVTKTAAEDLCVAPPRPRTSLRDPADVAVLSEDDDHAETRTAYDAMNPKVNEYLYRRVDIEDAVDAHLLALEHAPAIGFARYIVSATTPFSREVTAELRTNAPRVVARRAPGYEDEYARRNWRMLPTIDRVYVNERARTELKWRPRYDFEYILGRLRAGEDPRRALRARSGRRGITRDDAMQPHHAARRPHACVCAVRRARRATDHSLPRHAELPRRR